MSASSRAFPLPLPRAAALVAVALLAGCGGGGDAPAPTPTYYQTKTPYRAQQDLATYEPPPPGFAVVHTQLVARHGSRGLAGFKSDLVVYDMWQRAQAEGVLTELGERFGPDVLKIIRANFLLGYGVPGITKPGYGNETATGIEEHTLLAVRMHARLTGLFRAVGAADAAPRSVVVVSSGVDRAADSAGYFTASLLARDPLLAPRIVHPPAPAGYPAGHPKPQPDGTNRFLLYFHNLVPQTDLVIDSADPYYRTYEASQAYQAWFSDPDLLAREREIADDPAAQAHGRAALERLFTKAFVDRIARGELAFANTGTMSFTSDDGKFTHTLTGDGKATIASPGDAGAYLYDLYSVAPAMTHEAGVDFTPYLPPAQAAYFAYVKDAYDFYDKGPSIAGKGEVTYRMAQVLEDDFFAEVDAIARGDLAHAAKLRFTHAEVMIPFAAKMELPRVFQPVPLSGRYTYETNVWRGEYVSPMATNMQWDVFRDAAGTLLVRMLYNERETDFKAACDGAKIAPGSHYYEYTALRACYGRAATGFVAPPRPPGDRPGNDR